MRTNSSLYKAVLSTSLMLILSLATASCQTQQHTVLPNDQHTLPELIQSPNDHRKYTLLTLENQLSVLLISDPETDKSAASVSVFRGSYSNPENRAGLAHFLEHMLFLGTEKYPDADEYSGYISTHGGSNNAYTAAEHTNYFFDIQPAYMEGALDRFAQFFIAPRFDAEYVEREKNAVNSEYQLQLKDDGWRAQSVTRTLLNPKHPAARFTIGSLETLDGDVRSDLLTFAKNNYSANQMSLVVLGKENLPVLRAWVEEYFSDIPNNNLQSPEISTRLFIDGSLPKLLSYQTIKNTHALTFSFPVPAPDQYYLKKPAGYITNLLGHEGSGSLHEVLKSKGWIESLSSGGGRFDSNNGLIQVSMQLTQSGLAHVQDIKDRLFAYIHLIKSSGINAWRYQEQAKVAELGFQFQEKGSPQGLVSALSPRFMQVPEQHLLVANYLMQEFDKTLILEFMNRLTPDNMFMEQSGPELTTNAIEPWFSVPYTLETLRIESNDAPKSALAYGLALPERNSFLPNDLSLINTPTSEPTIFTDKPGLSAWYAPDTEFRVPRANIRIAIDTRKGNTNAVDMVRARLHASLINDSLNTLSYPARLAGLHYSVSASTSGFEVSIGGYNEKQALLLDEILKIFSKPTNSAEKLQLYQDEFSRKWDNFSSERPYSQVMATLNQLLISSSWPPSLLSKEIKNVSLKDLQTWVQENLAQVSLRVLMHGNINKASANTIIHTLENNLNLVSIMRQEPSVAKLKYSAANNVGADHPDSAMVAYIQSTDTTFSARAYYGLSAQLIRQPYFNQLRTEQQLGYVVSAMPATMRTTPGFAFLIQSPKVSSAELLSRTYQFLDAFPDRLENMDETEFEQYKTGLISLLTEKDKNLGSRTGRFWSDMDKQIWSFDSARQIANKVSEISSASYQKFFTRLSKDFKDQRLVIYSKGDFNDVPAGKDITNIITAKMSGEI